MARAGTGSMGGRQSGGESKSAKPFDGALFARRVRTVVRNIPRGRVATYGQVAELAGYPRHARRVGQVLQPPPGEEPVPWQRVINAQGGVSTRGGGQAGLLRGEGVRFSGGRVPLEQYRWRPEEGNIAWMAELREGGLGPD